MEIKCSTCIHFRHTEEVFDGYEDMGLISIPRTKEVPAHCILGCAIYQPECVCWQQEPTPFDGMIDKANEILNELKKECNMESIQIGDFVIKLEGDKLVIQHVGAPNKVIAVIPSSSNKVIIDTKEV